MNIYILIFLVVLVGAIILGLATGKIKNRVPFKLWGRLVWEDHKMPWTASGRAEIKRSTHDDHYICTGLIAVAVTMLLAIIDSVLGTHYFQVKYFSLPITMVLGWFFGFVINWIIEGRQERATGEVSPGLYWGNFEWADVRFGGYGGRDGALIAWLIIQAIF
ncbi:MAG: hypothetical protein ITG00_00160 [Flavobacterium sp.]|nr:hypothetical protein [Flavobacterium sp.]